MLEIPDNTSPDIVLRAARPEDQTPLYHACYNHRAQPSFESHFRRVLNEQEAGRALQLIAEVAVGNIIGGGQLVRYTGSRAEIADLVVRPAWRGQGVGTALIKVLARIAQANGITYLEIGVTSENHRALALYRRLGFDPSRELALCDGRSAFLLVKELAQPAARLPSGALRGCIKE